MSGDDKEKWIGEVFSSVEGMDRVKPRPDLLDEIESDLYGSEGHGIRTLYLRIAAAAAVVLLFLNVLALRQLGTESTLDNSELALEEVYEGPLVASYKLYQE